MKKFLTLLTVLCTVCVGTKAQTGDMPQWIHDLQTMNPGVIDSIQVYPAPKEPHTTTTYTIYYNQPLQHSFTDGEHFRLRALLTVPNDTDPTTAVNHVYCSGYSIMDVFLKVPDFVHNLMTASPNEIAKRYNANLIMIEHRYFQKSAPDNCWKRLDHLTAEEAAQDFHGLFEALKKVLKGKWVMSGVSKGGTTTLLQHTFFPADMDIFVPYSAPFFDTDRDTEMTRYWYTHGWSKEWRDFFDNIRKESLRRHQEIFNIFYRMNYPGKSEGARDTCYGDFIARVALCGFDEHAYGDTLIMRKWLNNNDSILAAHHMEYGDTVYAYIAEKETISLDSFPKWLATLRRLSQTNEVMPPRHKVTRGRAPFGITEKEWWSADSIDANAYPYQAKRELGYYDFDFSLIFDNDTEKAAEWNKYWREHYGCACDFFSPCYASLSFSRSLYDRTMEATRNATRPIVLIYGYDDTWTGAAVKDEYINGRNVRKFILPAQNHNVSFSSNTDREQCDAIREILDGVLSTPTDMAGIARATEGSVAKSRKVFSNGRMYILRDGKRFTVTGMEVAE